MAKKLQSHGLGRSCPRCRHFTVIFSGVSQEAVHLLPVTGKFKYPCGNCGWTLECDTRFLESAPPPEKSAKK
ncbi:MAG: hypothetical protein A3E78_07025 [Alphaproteobacteria bacterium RIFCSPHIGHO2_12_FULL_63_12]|nr:MAG: hypothetical protein A3E78_07025 [Alphaproteobacteria bacterium RIFCSPHIGHO2_12_FULL_63_12]